MYLLFEYYYAYVPQHMEGRLGIQCGAVDVVGEERKGHECAEQMSPRGRPSWQVLLLFLCVPREVTMASYYLV